jgi:hypothetical protein
LSVRNRVINPLVRVLLRSPAHRVMSRGVLLLTYTGRRSGRRYTLPVQYARADHGARTVVSRPCSASTSPIAWAISPVAPCWSPPPYDFTWAFVVREQPEGTTRLLVRERYAYTQQWAPFLVEPVTVVAFVMSQRMLRGIRDRAERGGRPTA